MPLLWLDSFDPVATQQFHTRYEDSTGSTLMTRTPGRTGSALFMAGHTGTCELVKVVGNRDRIVCGFAYKPGAFQDQAILVLNKNGGSNYQVTLRVNAAGTLSVLGVAGAVIATGTRLLSLTDWNYIEFKAVIDSAAGTLETRINGRVDFVSGGLNTQAQAPIDFGLDRVILRTPNPTDATYDDFYLGDSFLGVIQIPCLAPSGVGAHSDWGAFNGGTAAGGNHFTFVDELAGHDSDTTTVIATGAPLLETYDFASISGSVTDFRIVALGLGFVARSMTASGALYTVPLAPVVRTGGTDAVGSTYAVSGRYAHYPTLYETDPNTGLAWTPAGVDAAEFGVERAG